MKGKELAEKLGITLAESLLANTPKIVEHMTKKKEEKSFLEENKNWIFMIILSIFVVNLDYFNMFENVILNSIINIIFGIIVAILLYLYMSEEKNIFKINSKFVKTLMVFLTILGVINSFCHIGYAIVNLL